MLGKRPYLLHETEQEAEISDIKQMRKRVEQDRVEVYRKEIYQDIDDKLPESEKLPAVGFKKRQKKN